MSERIQVSYRPNPAFDEGRTDVPRLFATVDLSPYGAEEVVSALPITFRNLARPLGPVRQVYGTTVAGLRLEKGNLTSLEKSLDLYLGALVHFGRLPDYFFQVGARAWPIYRQPDQLVTRYPGSSVFGAETVGDLRDALAAACKRSGMIRNRKEVRMLALARHDLQLYQPLCMFRAPGISDIPVFPQQDGSTQMLIAPVNARALSLPLESGTDIFRLHEAVATYLGYGGRLEASEALTIRKLASGTWEQLQATLTPTDQHLSYHRRVEGRLTRCDLPLFRHGRRWLAARTNCRHHTSLHLGTDLPAVQHALGSELHQEGKLSSPHYLTLRRATAPASTAPATMSRSSLYSFS